MKKIRVASALTVAIASVLGVTQYLIGKSEAKAHPPHSFRIVYSRTFYPTNGPSQLQGLRVRHVAADGQWKEDLYDVQSSKALGTYWSVRDGQYRQRFGDGTLELLGRFDERRPEVFTAKWWKRSPDFVREDKVLGYSAYVLRSGNSDNYTETYRAPQFGTTPLKVILHRMNGDTVLEAIRVEFTEITSELVQRPILPVTFGLLNDSIKQEQDGGNLDSAKAMREIIQGWETAHSTQ
jgi:hypothetical protein